MQSEIRIRCSSRFKRLKLQHDFSVKTPKPKSSKTSKSDASLKLASDVKQKTEGTPSNWKNIYDNIIKMREKTVADIDLMGCEQGFDSNIDEKTRRFQLLITLILSSQTKNTMTYAAMAEMRKHNLSVKMIDQLSVEELEKFLKPVRFYKTKTKHLKKVARILIDKYDGDIPSTFDGMLELPGVGPKIAHLTMKGLENLINAKIFTNSGIIVAWNKVTGIAIDSNIHRVLNRLSLVQTKTPEETRIELEKWLPQELWFDANKLLVGFGQSICRPTNPKCAECLNNKICPSSQYSF